MKKCLSILLLLAIICTSLSTLSACSDSELAEPQASSPPLKTAYPPSTTTEPTFTTTEPTSATTTETTTVTTTEPPPPQYAEKVSFSQEDLYLVANGPSKTLYLSVTPTVVVDYSATVYAANSDIVSVSYNESDQSITFSGLTKGTTTVVALFAGGQHAVINVVVQKLFTSVTFEKEIIYLGIGEWEYVSLSTTPSEWNVEDASYTFSASTSGIATMNDRGFFGGISPGTTTITITYAGGAQASIDVVVLDVTCPQLYGNATLSKWDVIDSENMIVRAYSSFTFSKSIRTRGYDGSIRIYDENGTTLYENKSFRFWLDPYETSLSYERAVKIPISTSELHYSFSFSCTSYY